MVRVDHFPLKVQSLHSPVHLTHNVMWLALASDTKVPLASLDGSTSVCFLNRGHCLATWLAVPQRGHPLRMGSGSGGI